MDNKEKADNQLDKLDKTNQLLINDNILEQFEENMDRANRILKYLTQLFLGRKGLSLSRYRIMRYLKYKKNVNMSELQNRLLISGGSLTELVDSLEAEELVMRVRHQGDRRMVYLHLTEAGRTVYQEVLNFRCRCLRAALFSLEDGDIDNVTGCIGGDSPVLSGSELESINGFLLKIIGGLKLQIGPSNE